MSFFRPGEARRDKSFPPHLRRNGKSILDSLDGPIQSTELGEKLPNIGFSVFGSSTVMSQSCQRPQTSLKKLLLIPECWLTASKLLFPPSAVLSHGGNSPPARFLTLTPSHLGP